MRDNKKYASIGRVLDFFEEISAIPRGSSNTKGIADYLVQFAQQRGLSYHRDVKDNVVIRKPATEGFEDRPTVILQGHTDIVAEKREGCPIDMEKEGVKLIYDGDFLRADGTTLGGDDGVSVAYALALLDGNCYSHPAIEAVFTSDEEIGLIGATALDPSEIKGRVMINIDSDEEGVFTVGCAGGVRTDIRLNTKACDPYPYAYKLTLGGFMGGHSGIEIDKGRENAIKVGAEMLSAIGDMRLSSIVGGNADNAIPRLVECVFTLKDKISDDALAGVQAVSERYRRSEGELEYSITECKATEAVSEGDSEKIITLMAGLPTGVIAMSEDIPGLVETSLNMGIARLTGTDVFELSFSVRSAKGAAKESLVERLRSFSEGVGACFSTRGGYPAWEYRKESHLRDVMCEVYRKMYGKDASVVTIHAGLECGIFSDKLPGLDCVSIGPDNFDIHTPEEHLSLPSTMRVWEYLLEVLKSI